jgi:SAM-dependent methyltransferase
MSTPDTARATHGSLTASGARVVLTNWLSDVDTFDDAVVVAQAIPDSRFGYAWRRVMSDGDSPTDLFDEALAGMPCMLHGLPGGPTELPIEAWSGSCDAVDRVLVDECSGPSLDVGCGPGRLTHGLAVRGMAALGIDVSPGAVRRTRARGAQAIRRDVFDLLPAEGRWESVLLADGNIGIGGDPVRLLRRVESLMSPTGRALVEVAPPGARTGTYRVHLEGAGRRSSSFDWAVVGTEALDALAQQASLRVLWLVQESGRWFGQLARTGRGGCRG